MDICVYKLKRETKASVHYIIFQRSQLLGGATRKYLLFAHKFAAVANDT
jgi:hypothetical protein